MAPNYIILTQSSEEYKSIVKIEVLKQDDLLQSKPETLRSLAFATRLPQSLKALHLERYPCYTPLAYYALSEFVQTADWLLPRLKQLYLSDWSLESLEEKELFRLVGQKDLKYEELPNPFRIGYTTSHNNDSESEFEDSSEKELT